ncbi:glycosyltransferase [Aerococcus sp. L_32]|uniref:glycosyltransferase n=1 Tax=Aerococcus sp. L_32 TaxID=3422316 RepID=UPI003D6A0392
MCIITVLYISAFYPTVQEPFRGHYVEEQAIILAKNLDTNLVIIKPIFSKNIVSPKIDQEKINGHLVLSLQIPNYLGVNSIYFMIDLFKPKILKDLFKILKQYSITLMISNDIWGALKIGNLLNQHIECLHFNILHGESVNKKTPTFIMNKISEQMNQCDKIFAVSNKTKKSINQLLSIKNEILVNGNGLNSKIINRYKHYKFSKNKELTIVSIGNLNYNKGFDIVIEALTNVSTSFNYYIIGDGPYRQTLMEKCLKLNLYDNVKFVGNIPNEEVYKFLEKSHFFIQPSRNEAFGIVYLEGMITENIVIGTKGEGCEDFISDGENGFLVSSAKEISEILNSYGANMDSKIISKGKQTAIDYNWDKNVDRIINVYKEKIGFKNE